jgi:hypothetical protein
MDSYQWLTSIDSQISKKKMAHKKNLKPSKNFFYPPPWVESQRLTAIFFKMDKFKTYIVIIFLLFSLSESRDS